jgi:hypothetical protein
MPNIAPFAFPYGRSGTRYVPVAKVPVAALRRYRAYFRANASDYWIATDPKCARRVAATYGR